jgi:hypothetical protein
VHVKDRKSSGMKILFLKKFFAESRGNALGEEFFAENLRVLVFAENFFLTLDEELFAESPS